MPLLLNALRTTTRRMARGSVVATPLSPAQARDSARALAKALYAALFDWLVRKVGG